MMDESLREILLSIAEEMERENQASRPEQARGAED